MSMIIKDKVLEIIVPNSEAAICAQHNGISDKTVGSYYMSEKQKECILFLNGLNGEYLLDLSTIYMNSKKVVDKLIDLGWQDCFKDKLQAQKTSLDAIKWYMAHQKTYLYNLANPTINENNKYLKFDNTDNIFELVKSLILGDFMKIVIERHGGNVFIIYVDDCGKIEHYKETKQYQKWIL